MKSRETVLGLLALGLVLGGVFWVRVFQRSGPSASAERPGPPPEPWRARSSADTDAAIPDVTLTDGVVDLGDVRATLSVVPRPPVAFQQNRFRVRVESSSGQPGSDTPARAPLALEGGRISFEMTMPMGDHRYTLVAGADGWQEADAVLPFCKSGSPRWHAIVEGTVAGQPRTARFRLDLAPPGAAPAP